MLAACLGTSQWMLHLKQYSSLPCLFTRLFSLNARMIWCKRPSLWAIAWLSGDSNTPNSNENLGSFLSCCCRRMAQRSVMTWGNRPNIDKPTWIVLSAKQTEVFSFGACGKLQRAYLFRDQPIGNKSDLFVWRLMLNIHNSLLVEVVKRFSGRMGPIPIFAHVFTIFKSPK